MFTIKEGTPPEKVGEGTPPEVLSSIQEFLKKSGHVIRTADEDNQFHSTRTQAEVDRALGERYAKLDAMVFEQTGIPKNHGEKTSDYQKRALDEKLKEVTTLSGKVKEYETKGVEGSALVQQFKRDAEAAREQIARQNEEWSKKFADKENEIFGSRVESEIERNLSEVRTKLDPTIRPELAADVLAARLAKFRGEYQPYSAEGGVILWKNIKTQATAMSKQDGRPLDFKELFTTYVADIAGEGRKQQGAGSGGNGAAGGQQGGNAFEGIVLPAEVNTQMALVDYLEKERKLVPGSKEFTKAFVGLKGPDMKLR
jgi:hypothetical protein